MTDSDIIFHTTLEIKNALYKISTLKQEERERILHEVQKQLDDNGVTVYEWKHKLEPIFYHWYQEGKISYTDYESLKGIVSGL